MSRYFHGGARGLKVGERVRPAPSHVEDGCPICAAKASGRTVTVREYRAWLLLRGGPEADRVLAMLEDAPADGALDPPRAEQERVYISTDRDYARFYASRSRGDLYRVEPVGEVVRSHEDHFPSFTCTAAVVVEVLERAVLLTRAQRRELSRRWKKADERAARAAGAKP